MRSCARKCTYMKKHFVLLVLMLCCGSWLMAATVTPEYSTRGREFWGVFMDNKEIEPEDKSLELVVYITAETGANVTIEVPGLSKIIKEVNGLDSVVFSPDGGLSVKNVYLNTVDKDMELVKNKSIHIYNTDPNDERVFACYLYNKAGQPGFITQDASLLLPKTMYGYEYVVQTYNDDNRYTEFAIVATENNTDVVIHTPVQTKQGSTSISRTLNRGQSLFVVSQCRTNVPATQSIDLSGSTVCATKPVAVFAGNVAPKIPFNNAYSEGYAFEQLVPMDVASKEFYLSLFKGVSKTQYNLVALYPNTNVVIKSNNNGNLITTSENLTNVGDKLSVVGQLAANGVIDAYISSDQPVLCMQYMTCGAVNQEDVPITPLYSATVNWGNPTTALTAGWETRLNKARFAIRQMPPQKDPVTGAILPQKHFVHLVLRSIDLASLQIKGQDGNPVIPDPIVFNPFKANADMVYGSVLLPNESQWFDISVGGEGFTGYTYGITNGIGYLYTMDFQHIYDDDSLFITTDEPIMSPLSYNLERMPQGWLQRQPYYWLNPDSMRLDTAYICDSSWVDFSGQLRKDIQYDAITWRIYECDKKGKPTSKLIVEETVGADKVANLKQDWRYQFILDPQLNKQPAQRDPFTFYQVQMEMSRPRQLCTDMDPLLDTLKTMIRVNRIYNDTVWIMACEGDTVRGVFYETINGVRVESKFAVGATLDEEHGIYPLKLEDKTGPITRNYTTINGCDSLVTLRVYVFPKQEEVVTMLECEDSLYLHRFGSHFNSQTLDKVVPKDSIDNKPHYYEDVFPTDNLFKKLPDDNVFKQHFDTYECDSVLKLTLTVMNLDSKDTTAYWCLEQHSGAPFVWNVYPGKTMTIEKDDEGMDWSTGIGIGDFYDKFPYPTDRYPDCDCDSMRYHLHLIMVSNTDKHATIHLCQNETRTVDVHGKIDGSKLPVGLTQFRQTVSVGECSYEDLLDVYVHPIYNDTSDVVVFYGTICDGGTYRWEDANGNLHGNNGLVYCREKEDSVLLDGTVEMFKYEGSSRWPDLVYTFEDRQKTVSCPDCHDGKGGCDSIMVLHLIIAPHYNFNDAPLTLCSDDTVRWNEGDTIYYGEHFQWNEPIPANSRKLTKGEYTMSRHWKTVYDCDSTHNVEIAVYDAQFDSLAISLHSNQSYPIFDDARLYSWSNIKTVEGFLPLDVKDTLLRDTTYQPDCGCRIVKTRRVFIYPEYRIEEPAQSECQDVVNTYQWTNHDDHLIWMIDTVTKQKTQYTANDISLAQYGVFMLVDSMPTTTCKDCEMPANDSVFYQILTIQPIYTEHINRQIDYVAICSDDTITWNRGEKNGIVLYYGPDYDKIEHPIDERPYTYIVSADTVASVAEGFLLDSINLKNTQGTCDSTHYFHISISHSFYHQHNVTIGDNDSTYIFHHGCVYERDIVGQDFHYYDYMDHTKPVDYTQLTDRTMREVVLYDTLKTFADCDSIVEDTVRIYPTYYIYTEDTTCSNVEFNWRNGPDESPGKFLELNKRFGTITDKVVCYYYDSLLTKAYGVPVDSVFVLKLTVLPGGMLEINGKGCKNEPYKFNGYTLQYDPAHPDIDKQTATFNWDNEGGCGAKLTLTVDFHNAYFPKSDIYGGATTIKEDSVCRYDPYAWVEDDGSEHTLALYDEQGNHLTEIPTDTLGWITVYDSLKTKECKCDSVFQLNLFVKAAYHIYDTTTVICTNQSFTWEQTGKVYQSDHDSILRDTMWYTAVSGCDSIYFLKVKANQSYLLPRTDTICATEGQSYQWRGQSLDDVIATVRETQIKVDTILRDSLKTILCDCDSVYTDTVLIAPVISHEKFDTTCYGNAYILNERIFTFSPACRDTVCRDTMPNIYGCDEPYAVTLHILDTTHHALDIPAICADQETYDIFYSIVDGPTIPAPKYYMIAFDDYAHSQNFVDDNEDWIDLSDPDKVTLPMPVPMSGASYVHPDDYHGVISFSNGYCSESLPFTLPLRYPATILHQHWNDVINIYTAEFNGGYTFDSYQWYVNDRKLIGETKPYLYRPQSLGDSVYNVELRRVGEDYYLCTCGLKTKANVGGNPIDPMGPQDPYVAVTPTDVTKDHPYVHIISTAGGSYELLDTYGSLYTSGKYRQTASTNIVAAEVALPAVEGVYVMHLYDNAAGERSVKIMVH